MFPYSNRQEDDQAKTVKIVKRLVKKGELLKEDAEITYPSEWALYRDRYIVGPQGGRALGGNMMGPQKGKEPSLQNLKRSFVARKQQSSVERQFFKQYQKGKTKCTWSNITQYRYITITFQLTGIQYPKIILYSKHKYLNYRKLVLGLVEIKRMPILLNDIQLSKNRWPDL